MSFIIANQGLNAVISMSIPVLSIVYPVAITVVLLILIAKFIPTKRISQQIPVIIVFILSIFSVISKLGWLKINFIESLPLRAYSLEWFPVAIIATILGYLVGIFVKQDQLNINRNNKKKHLNLIVGCFLFVISNS